MLLASTVTSAGEWLWTGLKLLHIVTLIISARGKNDLFQPSRELSAPFLRTHRDHGLDLRGMNFAKDIRKQLDGE